MTDPKHLVDRYVGLWNDPDPEARRAAIAALWTEDGAQLLQPPQEVREAARDMAMTATFEVRGHAALEARVANAYERFIAPGEFAFRSRDNADRVGDVVTFNWEMVRTDDGTVAAVGLDVFVLAGDGRIRLDYQFIVG